MSNVCMQWLWLCFKYLVNRVQTHFPITLVPVQLAGVEAQQVSERCIPRQRPPIWQCVHIFGHIRYKGVGYSESELYIVTAPKSDIDRFGSDLRERNDFLLVHQMQTKEVHMYISAVDQFRPTHNLGPEVAVLVGGWFATCGASSLSCTSTWLLGGSQEACTTAESKFLSYCEPPAVAEALGPVRLSL
jgi:hypothetical protein